jgi:hypothetical protein
MATTTRPVPASSEGRAYQSHSNGGSAKRSQPIRAVILLTVVAILLAGCEGGGGFGKAVKSVRDAGHADHPSPTVREASRTGHSGAETLGGPGDLGREAGHLGLEVGRELGHHALHGALERSCGIEPSSGSPGGWRFREC